MNVRVQQAADYIGVSKSFLDKARCYGTNGPAYMRLGRTIVYDTAELDRWMQSCVVANSNIPADREVA
jgi:hypothetical protein